MQSDAEVFGLGKKKRTLKPGETGNEFDDYTYEDIPDAPTTGATGSATKPSEAFEAPEPNAPIVKTPKTFNGDTSEGMSTTQPVGTPQTLPATTTPAITDTPTIPKPSTSANVGHNGVTSAGLNREQYRDKWMSSGVKDIAGLKAWIAQNGGTLNSDNGTVTTPFGEQIDMLGAARTGNGTAAWTGVGGDAGADPLAALVASQGASGGAATTPTAATPSTSAAAPGSLEAMLAQQLSGGVDADPAVAAFRRSAERDFGRNRAQLAEEAAQGGQASSGGFDGRIRQLKENENEAVAGFAGNRAADVQKLGIQQDQFLKSIGFNYAQLDQQQKQFLQSLGQNRDQFLASLGLSYAQLSAQQKRDLDNLTLAYDQLEQQANRDAALTALGR